MRRLLLTKASCRIVSLETDSSLAPFGHVESANPGSTALEWHSLAGGVHDSPLCCTQ